MLIPKILIIALTLLFAFNLGCKKGALDFVDNVGFSRVKWATSWLYEPNQGSFSFAVHRTGCSANPVYSMDGVVFSDTAKNDSTELSGGQMDIGNLSFTPSGSPSYRYGGPVALVDTPDAKLNFGTTVTYQLAGNSGTGIQSFNTSMYIPKEILLDWQCCSKGVSKSNNLVVKWNSDANNNEGVYLIVFYDGPSSNAKNPSMPLLSQRFETWVSDNGTYTVLASNMSSFPVGGDIVIMIGRGNSKYITNGAGQKFELSGYSSSSHFDYIIQ